MHKNIHINKKVDFKNLKKALFNLFVYCKKHIWLIIISLLLAVIASILSVLGPNKLKELTNLISNGLTTQIDIKLVIEITLILIIIYLSSSLCVLFQNIFMTKVSQSVSKNLRNNISKKINKVPFKYIDKNSHGNLLSCVTNDVDTISQGLNNSVPTIVHSISLLIASMVMMFVSNWILAFTAIACSLLGFIIIALVMKYSQKYFVAQQNQLGEVNGHIEEIYSGQNIIKIYNATDEQKEKFFKLNNVLYKSAWKSQFLSGLMVPIVLFIGNFSYVAICVVGAILFTNGQTDIGTIVAFIMYARMFTNPLTQLAQSFAYLQSTAASSERVFKFLGTKEISDETKINKYLDPNTIKGNVKFDNVCFGYDKDKIIIDNLSCHVKAGQKVAIVGPTGAGKTTIVNLLMRFYEINDGKISIDGVDTKSITRKNLHELFGMVLQDTWLFKGTLRENLIFNNENVSVEELDKVCSECGLNYFVKTLPKGYETILDENTNVSIGQKQLITIARAMIQNSPMIILDEATSNVDTRTEILIQNSMDKLSKNRTSFVIAHRLSTIKNADLILFINEGKIVEKGKHKDLLKKNGVYAKLYNSQFEN